MLDFNFLPVMQGQERKGLGLKMLKRFIAQIDNLLFQGTAQAWYRGFIEGISQRSLDSALSHKIVIHYNEDSGNELAALCDKYGSDKGEINPDGHPYPWPSHSYTGYYARLFGHSRNTILNVFECGIGTTDSQIPSSMGILGQPGASLRVWREYFPNALIWGGDIDKKSLFQEARISTYYLDQLDALSIQQFFEKPGISEFDLMIDDGLHTFEAGSSLFINSIGKLAPAGVYVIEDVSLPDLTKFKKFFGDTEFLVDYVSLFRPNLGLGNNNLVVIRKPSQAKPD
jgi:hypothetical protein